MCLLSLCLFALLVACIVRWRPLTFSVGFFCPPPRPYRLLFCPANVHCGMQLTIFSPFSLFTFISFCSLVTPGTRSSPPAISFFPLAYRKICDFGIYSQRFIVIFGSASSLYWLLFDARLFDFFVLLCSSQRLWRHNWMDWGILFWVCCSLFVAFRWLLLCSAWCINSQHIPLLSDDSEVFAAAFLYELFHFPVWLLPLPPFYLATLSNSFFLCFDTIS